jgi:hypothetical protein
MRRDPVGNCLMHHAQMAGDAPQIHPIPIQTNGLLSYCVRIALFLWLRRIAPTAVLALKPLATGFRQTDFDLMSTFLAVRTFIHSLTLPHILSFSHSPKNQVLDVKSKTAYDHTVKR